MTNRDFKAEFISHFQNCPNSDLWNDKVANISEKRKYAIVNWISKFETIYEECRFSRRTDPGFSLRSDPPFYVPWVSFESRHSISPSGF